MRMRPPAVAGTFYPADPVRLRSMIKDLLDGTARSSHLRPKAIISPHAGYVYSGAVAAAAYATLDPKQVTRVVLLGPSHFVWFHGMALPGVDAFRTPLGDVPLADPMPVRLPVVASAHTREHSLEVQLPFLQMVLGEFDLVPIAIGDADAHSAADIIEEVAGGPETLIVVSSDLSHYLDYETAQRVDSVTADHIERGEGSALSRDDACGRLGIQGVLQFAERHGLGIRLLDLRNSGDTDGDRDRVVGYGAFAIA